MQYQTTRSSSIKLNFREMFRSVRPREGYYVPDHMPILSEQFMSELRDLSFVDRAKKIFAVFAPDLSEVLIQSIIEEAWPADHFQNETIYESKILNPYVENPSFVFMTNGKTGSYVDFAQALLLSCLKHLAEDGEEWYLVVNESVHHLKALAALDFDTHQYKPLFIIDKKSATNYALKEIQYVWNKNRFVDESSELSFDDLMDEESNNQNEINEEAAIDKQSNKIQNKEFPEEFVNANQLSIFSVKSRVEEYDQLAEMIFSNEEKINLLLKQNKHVIHMGSQHFVYYIAYIILLISAYIDLLNQEILQENQDFILAFPNNNLDFLYVSILLKELGLPISSLSIANNQNKAFVDFLNTGKMDVKRKFFKTSTPLLDQIYYSNMERFIFEIMNRDVERSSSVMEDLANGESAKIDNILQDLRKFIDANVIQNKVIPETVSDWYLRTDYLFDAYTALTLDNLKKSRRINLNQNSVVIPVLEHPLLSSQVSADALFNKKELKKKNFSQILELVAEESGLNIPIAALSGYERPNLVFVDFEEAMEKVFTTILEDE